MKNWGSTGVTNTLLLINAVFLMLLVINSSPRTRTANPHGDLSGMGAAPSSTQDSMMNPHDSEPDAGNMPAADAEKGGFSFQNMIFSALRCPSDGTVTLADASCRGKDADTRRSFVDTLAGQNLPPRMMFDKIIEKFGEKALSDEALEIRKNNRR